MKMDGHTHTQLCAHGSGEKTERMIEKAIRLGFTDYCITEHAPLPVGFEASYEGPREGYETASLGFVQLGCDRLRGRIRRLRRRPAGSAA